MDKKYYEILSKDGKVFNFPLNRYNKVTISSISAPDIPIIKDTEISVDFSFPLSDTVTLVFRSRNENGFSRSDIIRLVSGAYKRLYEIEAKTSKIDKPFFRNRKRNKSDGKFGIWGFDYTQLCIYGFSYNSERKKMYLSISTV